MSKPEDRELIPNNVDGLSSRRIWKVATLYTIDELLTWMTRGVGLALGFVPATYALLVVLGVKF